MKPCFRLLLCGVLLATASRVAAAVTLASPFSAHMVLQQDRAVPVWGSAEPGETVVVEFAGQKKSAVVAADGQWRVNLDALTASAESRALTVTARSAAAPLQIEDVLVGEVWLCGGQSNMERQLGPRPPQKPIVDWEKEVAGANYPQIRQFYVPQRLAPSPQTATAGEWTVCSPTTVANFTAVGYFFARDLYLARQVPIGIIHSSWGGTPAEAWTSRGGLKAFANYTEALNQVDAAMADPAGVKRAYFAKLSEWYRTNDPGSGDRPWNDPSIDTKDWETMNLPVYWENAGHADFDGVVWFRKTFDLPGDWKGHDLELRLSAIDDVDTTWVNGKEVGATASWNTPRAYRIPAMLLKPTGNVIAVRVLDTGGNGGIWATNLPFEVALANRTAKTVPLAGPWLCRFSVPMPKESAKRPPIDTTITAGSPTLLYNGMIAPLIPFAIRGVAFYQGEANAGRAREYQTLLPALIADWREKWGEGDFPFLFVQIAPFREMPPEIREAQLIAWQNTPNTAMAVTIDCGDADDIHPNHKQPVGARLALAARALAYSESLEYSGPVFASAAISGSRVMLHFTHVGGGLVAKDGPLSGFTVAGADGIFHPAQAGIEGETLAVSAPEVAAPVAVRYGWANVAAGNLFNRAGLPASPFRTDLDK